MLEHAKSGMICGACGSMAEESAGAIPFYLKSGSIQTALWKCQYCGTYMRDVDYENPSIREHFDVTSYTDPSTEQHWRTLRTGLFKYVIELAGNHLARALPGSRTLDFGTAFGILLELLRDAGARPEGVEVVPTLRELGRSRGLVVHEDLHTLPSRAYDLITAIDSFYYSNDPHATLLRFNELLTPEGVLILRLTNRTWYFDLVRSLGRGISPRRFDDIKFNYSIDGAARLLERSGFNIERVYWSDKGRGDLRPLAYLYYKCSPFLANYLSLRISPGMIIVARPIQ